MNLMDSAGAQFNAALEVKFHECNNNYCNDYYNVSANK